ncbi:MAG: hypothetical protein ACFB16_02995 [Phormidesmis sp.]
MSVTAGDAEDGFNFFPEGCFSNDRSVLSLVEIESGIWIGERKNYDGRFSQV